MPRRATNIPADRILAHLRRRASGKWAPRTLRGGVIADGVFGLSAVCLPPRATTCVSPLAEQASHILLSSSAATSVAPSSTAPGSQGCGIGERIAGARTDISPLPQ